MLIRQLIAILLMMGALQLVQGCAFMAGAATGAAATEVAEEVEDDDDGDD